MIFVDCVCECHEDAAQHSTTRDIPSISNLPKDLIPSYISILKQIVEHRLPREFDYHRVPAPWIQIKLLAILGDLGHADQKGSEQM